MPPKEGLDSYVIDPKSQRMKKEKPEEGAAHPSAAAIKDQGLADSAEENGLAFVDLSYRLKSSNDLFATFFEQITGMPLNKKVSLRGSALFGGAAAGSKTTRDDDFSALSQAFAGHQTEVILPGAKGGNAGNYQVICEPALDDKRAITGAFVSIRMHNPDEHSKHQKFKSIVESSGDAVIIFSPESKPIYASPSIKDVLGYTAEEIVNLDLYAAIHPDDLAGNFKVMERAILNPGIPIKGHTSRIMHKDGTWRWYESIVVNLINDPAVGGVVDNIREVTNAHSFGTQGDSLADRYEKAISASNIGVWELDIETQSIVRNLAHDRLFGYQEPITAWNLPALFNRIRSGDRDDVRALFEDGLKDGLVDIEACVEWPDGSFHWLAIKAKVYSDPGKKRKAYGTIIDVTEKRNIREALLQTEDRLKGIVDHLSEGLIVADASGRFLYWNRAAIKIHGFESMSHGLKNMPEFLKYFKLFHVNGEALPFKDWPWPALLRNEEVQNIEVGMQSLKAGWKKNVRFSGSSFTDSRGQKVYFMIVTDVSDFEKNKRAIKNYEQTFIDAFHRSPVALALSKKSDCLCLEMNQPAEQLLGFSFEEYEGKHVLELNQVSERSFLKVREIFRSQGGLHHEMPVTIITKNGVIKKILMSLEHVTLDSEECWLSIFVELRDE